MAHIVATYISQDPQLSHIFRATFVHAETPATPFLRCNQTQAKENLHNFKEGKCNLLVATVVADYCPRLRFMLLEDTMAATISTVSFAMTPLRTYGALWPPCSQPGIYMVLCNNTFIPTEALGDLVQCFFLV